MKSSIGCLFARAGLEASRAEQLLSRWISEADVDGALHVQIHVAWAKSKTGEGEAWWSCLGTSDLVVSESDGGRRSALIGKDGVFLAGFFAAVVDGARSDLERNFIICIVK